MIRYLDNAEVKFLPQNINDLLSTAIERKYVIVVNSLLEAKANPNHRTKPLIAAIQNQSIAIVQLLLEAKADPNVDNSAPLHAAQSDEKCTNLLIEYNAKSIPMQHNLLHSAVRCGDNETLRILIEQKADVNLANTWSPDPNSYWHNYSQYEHGDTPIGLAIYYNQTATVQLLINAKANLNLMSSPSMYITGRYSAYKEIMCKDNPEILEMLLQAKMQPNTGSRIHLISFIRLQNNRYLNLLLKYQFIILDRITYNVLIKTACRTSTYAVSLIRRLFPEYELELEHFIDATRANVPDVFQYLTRLSDIYQENSITLMYDAAGTKNIEVAKFLIESKLPFNSEAIEFAATNRDDEMIDLFVQNKVNDIFVRDLYPAYYTKKKQALLMSLQCKNTQSSANRAFMQHPLAERYVLRIIFDFI